MWKKPLKWGFFLLKIRVLIHDLEYNNQNYIRVLMKKSKDISKYDINWQVKRVSLKKLKTYQYKCTTVAHYLAEHSNIADKERVLNYLEGLSMAYKGDDRAYILAVKDELSLMVVSDANECSAEYSAYTSREIKAVVQDLMVRNTKWLKSGYRNAELLGFLTSLINHLDDAKLLAKLMSQIEASFLVANTHKFFF